MKKEGKYYMYFEDFEIGQEFRVENVKITKERILSFAADYDPLPIHLDEEYAKTTGFGGLIAPGVMSFMLVWAEYVRLNIWGEALVAGKRTDITWHCPVYAGDVLRSVATISDKRKKNTTGTLEVTVHVYNQNDQLVISDVSELVLKCRHKNE
ncbi:MAG: hypothetical protein GX254_01520 [Clostridiales bacterium]|nr:hypothetical protein [Clostridiales bacterium]